MRSLSFPVGWLLVWGCLVVATATVLKADPKEAPFLQSEDHNLISSMDQKGNDFGMPVMSFYIRYPKGVSPKGKVDGVFLYVTYLSEKKSLEEWLERPSSDDPNFQFADQHNLAVVTWTTATEYSLNDSFTDPTTDRNPLDQMENAYRTWKLGMAALCKEYNLPDGGYLIYGYSRGAQWAHRIVLRCPERFLAVHIHINSSFAEPVPEASHCLWLLTTGELEHGSPAARVFYQKGLALHYPILLRIYPGKAHEVFPEEEDLGIKFFEYALELKRQQLKIMKAAKANDLSVADDDSPPPLVFTDAVLGDFNNPPYYGDLLNGDVYSAAKKSLLPESQRVGIPDVGIAQSWGYFHP